MAKKKMVETEENEFPWNQNEENQETEDQETEDQETEDQETEDQETEGQETDTAADAERAAIVADMEQFIGHRAQVVPFNTATWEEAVITGVLNDKRTKKPLWVTHLLSNNKIVRKAYGSQLIKISDELVDPSEYKVERIKQPKEEKDRQKELLEALDYVGHYVTISSRQSDEMVKALVLGASYNKRNNVIMLRLRDEFEAKDFYRVFGAVKINVLDEVNPELVKKAQVRKEKFATYFDPKNRIKALKAEIAQLEAEIEEKKRKIEEAEFELGLNSQQVSGEPQVELDDLA